MQRWQEDITIYDMYYLDLILHDAPPSDILWGLTDLCYTPPTVAKVGYSVLAFSVYMTKSFSRKAASYIQRVNHGG